ncbi:HAD-like domain-containing protein [Cladochytrium replicatum]|nr:HAD-like domain-containing protein [Cladochytrium replicatum]
MYKTLRVVTFDAFSTLFRLRKSPGIVYSEEAARLGYNVSPENAAGLFVRSYKAMTAFSPNFGANSSNPMELEQWWKETLRRTLEGASSSPLPLEELEVIFKNAFARFSRSESFEVINNGKQDFKIITFLKLYDDVVPMLKQLDQASVKMGVISNSDYRTRAILEGLNISQYFSTIVLSHELGIEKPSPDIFGAALREIRGKFGPASEELVVHVGDDTEKDHDGAINAGFKAMLVDREKGFGLPRLFDVFPELRSSRTSIV